MTDIENKKQEDDLKAKRTAATKRWVISEMFFDFIHFFTSFFK